MKLALLIGLTADKQSGKALTELAPFDQTLEKFKEWVNKGEAPSDKYPLVHLWTTSGVTKQHQFKPDQLPTARKKAKAAAKKQQLIDHAQTLRSKADDLKAAADEATAAADASKGKPEHAELMKAAQEAAAVAGESANAADAAEKAAKQE